MSKLLLLYLIGVSGQSIAKERENAIVKAVKKAEKSVVSITCFQTRYVSLAPGSILNDPFFREFFEFFDFPQYKEKISSQGSGFIISSDGYILTNEHVIHGADSIIVTLPNGGKYPAELIGADFALDIALLKIDEKGLPFLKFANSDNLERGEWAIAMGNPFGYLWEDTQPTVTVGVISAVSRTFKGEGERIYRGMIQTDAAINPGNSGGPLLNSDGEVIGMNTFIVSKSGGFEGIGFAIPSNTLKEVLPYIKKYGYYPRAFIGIETAPSEQGVKVNAVFGKGPAGRAGLETGDIILKIGRQVVKNYSDYRRYIDLLRDNAKVVILLERNGKKEVINFRTISRYEGALMILGIELDEDKYGVYIRKIKKGGYGSRIGLRKGDYIVEVNGERVNKISDLKRILSEYVNRKKDWKILRGRFTYEFTFKEMD